MSDCHPFATLILKNCSEHRKSTEPVERLADSVLFLLGQGPVSIEEFFADPKNGTLETKKPPAMRVVEVALAHSIKPPVLQ